MALTTYDYDKDSVDQSVLSAEILASSITSVETEFDGTENTFETTPTQNLHITWLNALSAPDKTTLDGLVTAHVGTPMPLAEASSKILSRTLTTPPVSPSLRDSYIVATGATGAWAGMDKHIAVWAKTAWEFFQETVGITAFVVDEGVTYTVDAAGEWEASSAKRKINATVAPTVTDDKDSGYSVGSHWIDVTLDNAYICVDATVGAAVWVKGAASAHSLGGGDHSADTLANLNAKVSDATLDDASATRTPTAHTHGNADLTGVPGAGIDTTAVHDDTAAEISAVTEKVTPVAADLLLIEDSAAANAKKRVQIGNLPTGADADAIHDNVSGEINVVATKATPVAADVILIEDSAATFAKKKVTVGSLPSGGGGAPASSIAEASGDTTETSVTDVLVVSMTLTPASGTYAVTFTSSVELSANNSVAFFSIYSAGSQVAASERKAMRGAGQGDVGLPFTCVAKVTVNGSQAIEGRVRVSAGTATIHQRTLMLVEVAP